MNHASSMIYKKHRKAVGNDLQLAILRPERIEVSHVKAEKGVLFRRRSLEETLQEFSNRTGVIKRLGNPQLNGAWTGHCVSMALVSQRILEKLCEHLPFVKLSSWFCFKKKLAMDRNKWMLIDCHYNLSSSPSGVTCYCIY